MKYNSNNSPITKCPRCGGHLKKSFVRGYKFFCPHCYEDFYGFEVGGVAPRRGKMYLDAKRSIGND